MRHATLIALLLATPAAQAAVIGGEVTGGSALTVGGTFTLLDPQERFAVGFDTFQTPHLYAFDEDQNIEIDAPIAVDIGISPQKGDVVASHYVFFDPAWGTGQTGYVEFDAPIFGIATSTGNLAASDYLANTEVEYLNATLRGLEFEDSVWIDPEDPFRLRVAWVASTPGDYVRVFTRRSPVARAPGKAVKQSRPPTGR
ncbi:MAG: hypothetical protein AAGE18_08300 [Pseudomonadota bacterium]